MKELGSKTEYVEPELTDEFVFDIYQKRLQLSPEDLNKKILDVGSGSGQFAREAKKRGFEKVFSVDPAQYIMDNREKTVKAEAEKLPFKDSAFDLVLSLHSVPIIFAPAGRVEYGKPRNWREFEQYVKGIIKEMLRVLKKGGEIRLCPIVSGRLRKIDALIRESMNRVMASLISEGAITAEESSVDEIIFSGQDKKDIVYMIKIKKLK